ncbi:MAG: hypothetical protein M3P06_11705 [Acidobacteriota bacterium]|nr:hypothetical protein [Acidobacteriota bacterium]
MFTIALALAGAVVLYASPQPEFVAAWRAGAEAALLDSTGHVHVYGSQGKVRTLTLTASGSPMVWRHAPTGFARWNSEWLVADGTTQLKRFNASGAFIATVAVPANLFDLAVAGQTLWAANCLSKSPSNRLWSSTDGRRFTPVPMKDDIDEPLALLYRNFMILAGSSGGDLFIAHSFDAPLVHRIFPFSNRATWPVAYSRSKSRASLEVIEKGVEDLTMYSSPVRDMLALPGELIVLRNREDVRTPQGVITQQGLRADRYGVGGRHVSSATFAEPMKWILRSDRQHVTGVTKGGVVRVARWGKPIAGGIVR